MQLRLSRFDGLKLSLERGWYLVPSHVSAAEVRRLLDVLASGLDGVDDVLELDWEDCERLGPDLGASTLAYLCVPDTDARAQIEAVVAGWELRLGLLHLPDAACWPDPAWDELEVKAALVGWFRREFARKDHPLACLGIAHFPLQRIAEATAEPIELIELIEAAIVERWAAGEGTDADWDSSIADSIARRLADRLETVEEMPAVEIVELIVNNDDGHLRASMNPHAIAALLALGLATRAGDDVLLGPLARCAKLDAVRASLEVSAAEWSEPEPDWRPRRRLIDITAGLAELGYAPGAELARALADDSTGPPRVFVVHQRGMGGSTYIREVLDERAVHGDYAVFVSMLSGSFDSEVADLLLTVFAALLTKLADAKLEIDRTAFCELERGFAELVGDAGAVSGIPRSERVSPRELRRLAQRSLSARRSSSGRSWSSARVGLMAMLVELLAMFGVALSARQQHVLLVLEAAWVSDRDVIDEFFTALEALPIPLVFDWDTFHWPLPEPASRCAVVHVPPLPLRGKSDGREVVRPQLLDVALELLASAEERTDAVADPAVLHELVRLSGGSIGQLLNIKQKAEEYTRGRLSLDDLRDAAGELAEELGSECDRTAGEAARLREIAQTRSLALRKLGAVTMFDFVFVYEGGAWVDINPLLWQLPWFVKAVGPELGEGQPRGVLARVRDRLRMWLEP